MSWALFDVRRSADAAWLMFTGDFILVGELGRPESFAADHQRTLARQLHHSVFERAAGWPDYTEIFPLRNVGIQGGPTASQRRSSTIGYERHFNSRLKSVPQDEWVAAILKDLPTPPSYFAEMKRMNRQGPLLIGPMGRRLKRRDATLVNELVEDNGIVLDVRSKEAFSAAHLPHSINIPLSDSLPAWAGRTLPYDQDIMLLADSTAQAEAADRHLSRVGYDRVIGSVDDGVQHWEAAATELSSLRLLTADTLASRRRELGKDLRLLDVRSVSEWRQGHIDGAQHVEFDRLSTLFETLERDQPISVVCGTGYGGSIAGSLLQQAGFTRVTNVVGGMDAWREADLPIISENPEEMKSGDYLQSAN